MRKVKKWKLTGIFVCVIAMVLTSCHEKATDYSQKSNWLNQPEITKDVLSCPANEIHEAKPAATYFEGKKVFSM